MPEQRGSFAGFYQAFVCKRNTNGFPVGQAADPESIANSTPLHAYHLFNPVEATVPTPDFQQANFKGGQKYLGIRPLGVGAVAPFDLTLTGQDEKFNQLIGGGFDETLASLTGISVPNTNKTVRPQLMLGLTIGFDNEEGEHIFVTSFYLNVTILPSYFAANQNAGENPNPLSYRVFPQMSLRTPFGILFEDTTLNVQENKEFVLYWRTDYPVSLTTYVAAAADTQFTLGYLPKYADIGGETNIFTLNGDEAGDEINTVSTSTGVVGFDSAYGNGDIYVSAYQTEFASIPA